MFTPTPFRQPIRRLSTRTDLPANTEVTAAGHTFRLEPDRVVVTTPDGGSFSYDGQHGLPVGGLTCLALDDAGNLWLGSRHGLVRCHGGQRDYYGAKRWLPENHVLGLACDLDRVEVMTTGGPVAIEFEPLTLEAKAAHYEAQIAARHKRYGYVTGCSLAAPGDLDTWRYDIQDNDGLWTAMYVAAEAFRYAVTGDPAARALAAESFDALLRLEQATPIDGFPARALTHRTEADFGRHTSGEWHATADGEWEWKADTSSDEMDGHYFVWGIYHDLVADEPERERLRTVVRRCTDHILEHGGYLCDLDGQPTRWGVWAPERLNGDPAWRAERGLNSLEYLSYLRTAHHLTGEPRYLAAYHELVEQHHYALNTIEQRVMPGDFPGAEENHSDDELAFLAYYNLLRYEDDPTLRGLYLASLERTWQQLRPTRAALWNLIYGGLTGRPCDLEIAVTALQEIPLDLLEWTTTNSHRLDLELNPAVDRGGRPQLRRPLSWRERPLHKWNGNPYRLDGGNDRHEECGTFWLLPYWLGRSHGLLGQTAG